MVLSAGTYNGNLGGLSGANALCLTDLQQHSWLGKANYPTLSSSNVFALLCDSSNCNNLLPSTSYYLASSGNVFYGGAQFTTDSFGRGPDLTGGNYGWSGSNALGRNVFWWSNLGGYNQTTNASGNPLWSSGPWDYYGSPATDSCSNWTTSSASSYGNTGDTAYGPASYQLFESTLSNGQYSCNNSEYLLCYVNP